MNIEFNGKFLYDSETGERICSIEDLKDRKKNQNSAEYNYKAKRVDS